MGTLFEQSIKTLRGEWRRNDEFVDEIAGHYARLRDEGRSETEAFRLIELTIMQDVNRAEMMRQNAFDEQMSGFGELLRELISVLARDRKE